MPTEDSDRSKEDLMVAKATENSNYLFSPGKICSKRRETGTRRPTPNSSLCRQKLLRREGALKMLNTLRSSRPLLCSFCGTLGGDMG